MTTIPAFLQTSDTAGLGALLAFSGMMMFIAFACALVVIIGIWKVFTKAGQPGWAAIIPIYNMFVLLKIIGRPAWWILLMLIPLVNIVIFILVAIDLAKAFGQSAAFGVVLLFLFSIIGYLMLGFGNYRYMGPVRAVA